MESFNFMADPNRIVVREYEQISERSPNGTTAPKRIRVFKVTAVRCAVWPTTSLAAVLFASFLPIPNGLRRVP